jgi:hypothetical protein
VKSLEDDAERAMNLTRSLYRNTLVAAALAVGSLAGLPAAAAHVDGWRGQQRAATGAGLAIWTPARRAPAPAAWPSGRALADRVRR